MKKITSLLLLFVIPAVLCNVFAQCYEMEEIAYDRVPGDSGTVLNLGDGDVSSSISLGFTFNYFGNKFSHVKVASKGVVRLGTGDLSPGTDANPIPSSDGINNIIALYWADLDPGTSGEIEYFTTGTAPDRKFVVNFDSVPHYRAGQDTGGIVTTQLVLHENSDAIEFHTKHIGAEGRTTMGIENADGSSAYVVKGRNHTYGWSAQDEGIRFVPRHCQDSCNQAKKLPVSCPSGKCNFHGHGDLTNATQTHPACAGDTARGVWYRFTTKHSEYINIEVTPHGQAMWNPVIELYDACGGALMACASDSGAGQPEVLESGDVETGQTYYLRIYNHASSKALNTTYDVCVYDSSEAEYFVNSIPYSPDTGSGHRLYLSDDGLSDIDIPIGFSFDFYGETYSDLRVSPNGFLTFTSQSPDSRSAQSIPDTSAPNNLIAFAWQDLNPEKSGVIEYFTTGTAPNRKFILNFDRVEHSRNSRVQHSRTGDSITSQVVLYEGSNIIEIHSKYLEAYTKTTMGLENQYGSCATTLFGGRNNSSGWVVSEEGLRFRPEDAPLPTGINSKRLKDEVVIYPNPVKNMLTFSIPSGKKVQADVRIFDNQGKTVYKKAYNQRVNKSRINTRKWSPGMYIFRLNAGDRVITKTFMKK